MALYIVYYTINFIACLICGVTWQHAPKPLRYQWIYLTINLVIELICHYMAAQDVDVTFLYNVVIPVEYGFFVYLIGSEWQDSRARNIAWASVVVLGLYSVVHLIFLRNYSVYNYGFLTRCVFMVIVISRHFYTLYVSDKVIYPTRQPSFWISCGFLIFCVGTFFVMGLYALLRTADLTLANEIYRTIMPLLNSLLYSTFIIAALCNQGKSSWYSLF